MNVLQQTAINILNYLLPKVLRTDFWTQLANAFSTEYQNLKLQYGNQIENIYYTRNIINPDIINSSITESVLQIFGELWIYSR